MSTFSQRHGFEQPDAPITIRSEAPDWLRNAVVRIAYSCGLDPSDLRELLCELLLESPDSSNWSEFPNIDNEVQRLLAGAEWFHVYDFVELVAQHIERRGNRNAHEQFTQKLNDAFRRKGVGWQLVEGQLEIRGEESFEKSVRTLPIESCKGHVGFRLGPKETRRQFEGVV
jgi:hypothetical protein